MSQKSPKYLIPTDKNVKTVTDMREKPIEMITGVKEDGPVYIFHHSKPKAIMLSTEEYQALLDEIEDLEDALYAQSIEKEVLATPTEDLIPSEDLIKKYEE